MGSKGSQRQWASSIESRKVLFTYGIHINDAANRIPIGHPRPHNAMYTRSFHDNLRDRLTSLVEQMRDTNHGKNAIRTALRRELRKVGARTLS
ncbi:AHH domain-containing protein [Pseudomonas sp. WHRI 8519]|uniref:AHH domain-containing protein n=1 Tax=Pseudomonas sp. WHRI 8519 TaxID=3162567 RepID=UPI0032EFC848